jgi:hypothetical protein
MLVKKIQAGHSPKKANKMILGFRKRDAMDKLIKEESKNKDALLAQ